MRSPKKSFIVALVTIFSLMLLSFVLANVTDCNGISFLKFIASPILALNSDSGVTTIAICVFLLIIGGIANSLDKCGFMEYMLNKIAYKYSNKRYKFICVIVLFFMIMGSLIGTFEEVVPIVPLCVILAKDLGFDEYTGMGMSLLAVGCGFAAGVFNPFTIGVAQELAGLPLFSGVSLRILSFVLIYLLLITFLTKHAKSVAKDINETSREFLKDKNKEKAFKAFIIIMVIGLTLVFVSPIIKALQDYTIIITALAFLISGLTASIKCNLKGKELLHYFISGATDVLPSIILILMATSIKFIMDESGCINVILNAAITVTRNMNNVFIILFIYLICLILELFVPSGSAKAFLLMPLLIPLANEVGISTQLVIVAYAFGDGFSNVLYPTNPALLISLGLIDMNYKDWFKYSIKFQGLNLLLTSLILILGLVVGY